jgi:hypothetical protein
MRHRNIEPRFAEGRILTTNELQMWDSHNLQTSSAAAPTSAWMPPSGGTASSTILPS